VPLSNKLACRVAQLYYKLGEKNLEMGFMTKALFYARQGLQAQFSLIEEPFMLPSDKEGGEVGNPLHMNATVAASVWSLSFEDFILAPNCNFIGYLNGIHQEATILELMGQRTEALNAFELGKTLSLRRGSSFLAGCFHAAIVKIHRKSLDLELAEVELQQAKEQCANTSCRKCKLLLNVEILKESVKLIRKKGSTSQDTQGTENDLVYAASMLQKELSNLKGCECWDHSCRFSLLNVLDEIGKDHVFNNKTEEAQDAFMKNIHVLFSFTSLSPSQFPKTFSEFFEIVEKREIEFSYKTHIAHIIYLIGWLAYRMRKKCADPFSISLEKLISSMNCALKLSSEVPELFQKVAQLLAIIYFLSHKELPQSKITHYQWACFYHQLTVNSGVDYSFSSRLIKVCGDSNPDDILHRLTPSVDVDLSEFVEKYFSDLLPHTTVVINILGKKYKDLLKTLVPSSVPSNCVGLMMVSRFKLKNKPLVGLFSIDSGSGKPFSGPRGTSRIVDTIALEFSGILNDYYKPNSDAIGTLDDRFLALVCRMQNWFGGYEYILLGEPVGSPKVQNLDYPWGFVGVGVNDSSLSSPTYGVSHLYSEDTCERAPIILVLDNNLHMLPWECLKVSKNQDIYRMPSVSSTFYTYYKHVKSVRYGDFASYASLNPFNAYYVINPDKSSDKEKCEVESELASCFKKEFRLKGTLWEDVKDDIKEILRTRDLFIYAGHGDGLNHLPSDVFETLDTCAAASLMGCSSALLQLKGPYIPEGAPLDYLLAGSPIVVGNLWDIYGKWPRYLYIELLRMCKKNMVNGDEVSIGSCLVLVKNKVNDRHVIRGATVCYGVPTLIREHNERELR
ncbi:separase isoform X4, partial [Tanacetum coccineum]